VYGKTEGETATAVVASTDVAACGDSGSAVSIGVVRIRDHHGRDHHRSRLRRPQWLVIRIDVDARISFLKKHSGRIGIQMTMMKTVWTRLASRRAAAQDDNTNRGMWLGATVLIGGMFIGAMFVFGGQAIQFVTGEAHSMFGNIASQSGLTNIASEGEAGTLNVGGTNNSTPSTFTFGTATQK